MLSIFRKPTYSHQEESTITHHEELTPSSELPTTPAKSDELQNDFVDVKQPQEPISNADRTSSELLDLCRSSRNHLHYQIEKVETDTKKYHDRVNTLLLDNDFDEAFRNRLLADLQECGLSYYQGLLTWQLGHCVRELILKIGYEVEDADWDVFLKDLGKETGKDLGKETGKDLDKETGGDLDEERGEEIEHTEYNAITSVNRVEQEGVKVPRIQHFKLGNISNVLKLLDNVEIFKDPANSLHKEDFKQESSKDPRSQTVKIIELSKLLGRLEGLKGNADCLSKAVSHLSDHLDHTEALIKDLDASELLITTFTDQTHKEFLSAARLKNDTDVLIRGHIRMIEKIASSCFEKIWRPAFRHPK